VRLLSEHEVVEALDVGTCIDAMREALLATTRDEVVQPLRQVMWLPDRRGALAAMPAMVGNHLGIKVLSYFPGNSGTALDPHQGWVVLFDADDGRPLAALDASAITWIRTAAVSAVATDALARPDAAVLTVVGTGAQALWHARAVDEVRDLQEVRVWGRRPERAQALAAQLGDELKAEVRAVADLREALTGADVVCTTTSSSEPVVPGAWLEPGMHVNAVGASVRAVRELDGDAVARSSLFVDRRDSAINEAGDIVIAREEGVITDAHIRAEIAEVLAGTHAGRGDGSEVTLFKSVGLALEDVAAASAALRRLQNV